MAALLAIAASFLPRTADALDAHDCFRELRRHGEFRTFTRAIRSVGLSRNLARKRNIGCLSPVNSAFHYNPVHRIQDRVVLRSRIRSHFVRKSVARQIAGTTLPLAGPRIRVGQNLILPVDRVIVPINPNQQTLLEIIYGDPYFTIFSELIRDAGLTGLFVQDIADYTVFAPSDGAFLEIAPYLGDMNRAELSQIVRDHVLRNRFLVRDFESGTRLFPLSLRPLHVLVRGDDVYIENAMIRRRYNDVTAINGVLHEVDQVILVP